MKKKELIEIIRFAVREELKEILPEIIKECVNTTPTKINTPKIDDPVELTKQVLKTEVRKPKVKKKKVIRYAKNEVLNKVLNETKGGIPQEGTGQVFGEGSVEENVTDFNGNKVTVDELPEPLAEALTRDYSELMSAINKKKGVVGG